mgnify:CR=1 FL=1
MRYVAWVIKKKNGSYESSKRIDPTNAIRTAVFNTKRHAKAYQEEHPILADAKLTKVTIKITEV